METIYLIYFVVIIFAIFEIALMFKIWGACNNICKLREHFVKVNNVTNETPKVNNVTSETHEIKEYKGFKTNDTVIVNGTDTKLKVIDFYNDKILCGPNGSRYNSLYYYPNELTICN